MLQSKAWRSRMGAAALTILLAACTSAPEKQPPGPLDEPIDAFEAVGAPRRPGGAPQGADETLSTDIQRLQNARETYRHEQMRLRAERRRARARCRARPDARQVPIEDGTGDPNATYCRDPDANRASGH